MNPFFAQRTAVIATVVAVFILAVALFAKSRLPMPVSTSSIPTPTPPAHNPSGSAQRAFRGSWTDDVGDVSQGFIDLYIGSLATENSARDLAISINLAGLFPNADVDTKFEILFDTDNNSTTGVNVPPFRGIEKIIEISLTGRYPFKAPAGTMRVQMITTATDTRVQLIPGSVTAVQEIIESKPPSVKDAFHAIDQVVPFRDLGLTAPEVPVGIRSTNLATAESDSVSLYLKSE